MSQEQIDHFQKLTPTDLTDHDRVVLMMLLCNVDSVHAVGLGRRLARQVSEEWRQVFEGKYQRLKKDGRL